MLFRQKFQVKVIDRKTKEEEFVGPFIDFQAAAKFAYKLQNGSAGAFHLFYEVKVESMDN